MTVFDEKAEADGAKPLATAGPSGRTVASEISAGPLFPLVSGGHLRR